MAPVRLIGSFVVCGTLLCCFSPFLSFLSCVQLTDRDSYRSRGGAVSFVGCARQGRKLPTPWGGGHPREASWHLHRDKVKWCPGEMLLSLGRTSGTWVALLSCHPFLLVPRPPTSRPCAERGASKSAPPAQLSSSDLDAPSRNQEGSVIVGQKTKRFFFFLFCAPWR